MQELIETIIIYAQQNFEIADVLNPVQIEIENGLILKNIKMLYIN